LIFMSNFVSWLGITGILSRQMSVKR
jgi:hypothetical protein